MAKSEKYIAQGDKYLLHTYNRFPIVIEKGDGVYLFDADGKKYLDFAAGIAVYALGYNNKDFNTAVKKQLDLIAHTSNLYYNEPACMAAEKVAEISGMDRVFFTNSGTEAIEGAIKTARKYAFTRDGHADHEIIAMEHSFHGRSMGALSVTGNAHYREAFEPGIGNVRFAAYNDLDSVKALTSRKTCAVILETVQGEGGIYPAEPEFIKGIRKLCDDNDILMILDEIQCGMGRTGNMFAFMEYGVKPDILTMAKALGNGLPAGAFAMTERVAENSLVPGDHGTTYGGNPLACAAVLEVLRQFGERDIVGHVRRLTPVLEGALDELKDKYGCIRDRRGRGFMQALELDRPAGDIVRAAQAEGLLIITAGSNILRIVPPLIIEEEHIEEMKKTLDKVFGKS